jgi:hypothetical protein
MAKPVKHGRGCSKRGRIGVRLQSGELRSRNEPRQFDGRRGRERGQGGKRRAEAFCDEKALDALLG